MSPSPTIAGEPPQPATVISHRSSIGRRLWPIALYLMLSIVLFGIISLAPGDPLAQFAADPRVPEAVKENIRKQLGLNDPLPVQYA